MHAIRSSFGINSLARCLRYGGFTIRAASGGKFIGQPPKGPRPAGEVKISASALKDSKAKAALPPLALTELVLARENPSAFVQQLKNIANSTTANPDKLVTLMDAMVGRIGTISDISDWLFSMGKLGFKFSNPKHRPLILKSAQKLISTQGLTCRDVSACLHELTKTGIKLSNLSAEQQGALMKMIEGTALDLIPRGIANVLNTLSKLGDGEGGLWDMVPLTTQEVLWSSVEKNTAIANDSDAAETVHSLALLGLDLSKLTDAQLNIIFQMAKKGISRGKPKSKVAACQNNTMTILHLGKMGFTYSQLPADLYTEMGSCVLATFEEMTAQQAVHIIYALGQMHCPWTSISPELHSVFQKILADRFSGMTSQGVFMTLHGLAHMGVQWDELKSKVRKEAILAVEGAISPENAEDPNVSQCLAVTVFALNKMGAEWKSFTPTFRQAVLNSFVIQQAKFLPSGVSNSIHGFGCMHVSFQELLLTPNLMEEVENSLDRHARIFNAQALSIMLFGFSEMGALWQQLPTKKLEPLLLRLAATMTNQELANAMNNLANMEVSWHDLPADVLEALVGAVESAAAAMNEQEISNCMYGVTMMCFDLHAKPTDNMDLEKKEAELMWRMIRALVKQFGLVDATARTLESQAQCSAFFEWLSKLPGGNELIVKELGSRPSFSENQPRGPTRVHLSLSEALPAALKQLRPNGEIRIENEFSGLGGAGFAMDIAVFDGSTLLAFVEVDGFFHASTGLVSRQRLLKRFLYGKRYPKVEVHRVRTEEIVTESANNVAATTARLICKKLKAY